jgi:hypothetical protein
MSILQRLYDSEINVWITSFWDDGFYARLGDEMNGYRAEGRCDTWVDVERSLDQQARALPGQHLCPRQLMFATSRRPSPVHGYRGLRNLARRGCDL